MTYLHLEVNLSGFACVALGKGSFLHYYIKVVEQDAVSLHGFQLYKVDGSKLNTLAADSGVNNERPQRQPYRLSATCSCEIDDPTPRLASSTHTSC